MIIPVLGQAKAALIVRLNSIKREGGYPFDLTVRTIGSKAASNASDLDATVTWDGFADADESPTGRTDRLARFAIAIEPRTAEAAELDTDDMAIIAAGMIEKALMIDDGAICDGVSYGDIIDANKLIDEGANLIGVSVDLTLYIRHAYGDPFSPASNST